MKKLIIILLLCLIPSFGHAASFADTDQMYMWDGTQYFPAWTDLITKLDTYYDVSVASGTDAIVLTGQEFSADANVEQLADLTLQSSSVLGVDASGNIQTYAAGELLPVSFGITVVSKATSATLTAAEVGNTLVLVTAATQTITLPTAVAGYATCISLSQGVTGTLTVTPAAGDYIVVDGTRGTAATAYAATSALGNKLCIVAADADDWYITGSTGVWSE